MVGRAPHRAAAPGPSAARRARVRLLAVIVLRGADWPVTKIGLEPIAPLWFAAARQALGAATLFATLITRGGRR